MNRDLKGWTRIFLKLYLKYITANAETVAEFVLVFSVLCGYVVPWFAAAHAQLKNELPTVFNSSTLV